MVTCSYSDLINVSSYFFDLSISSYFFELFVATFLSFFVFRFIVAIAVFDLFLLNGATYIGYGLQKQIIKKAGRQMRKRYMKQCKPRGQMTQTMAA